jgi:hypothetical protein
MPVPIVDPQKSQNIQNTKSDFNTALNKTKFAARSRDEAVALAFLGFIKGDNPDGDYWLSYIDKAGAKHMNSFGLNHDDELYDEAAHINERIVAGLGSLKKRYGREFITAFSDKFDFNKNKLLTQFYVDQEMFGFMFLTAVQAAENGDQNAFQHIYADPHSKEGSDFYGQVINLIGKADQGAKEKENARLVRNLNLKIEIQLSDLDENIRNALKNAVASRNYLHGSPDQRKEIIEIALFTGNTNFSPDQRKDFIQNGAIGGDPNILNRVIKVLGQ